jgi:hypothetical protein
MQTRFLARFLRQQSSSGAPRQPKRPFTPEEDAILTKLVSQYGERVWYEVEKELPGRTSRQCRERWNLYLSPGISNEPWTLDDDSQLLQLYQVYGPKWTVLASSFPKRTANNIKNRYKQLARQIQRIARIPPATMSGFSAGFFWQRAMDPRELATQEIVVPMSGDVSDSPPPWPRIG